MCWDYLSGCHLILLKTTLFRLIQRVHKITILNIDQIELNLPNLRGIRSENMPCFHVSGRPRTSCIFSSNQGIHNVNAPLPCSLGRRTLPKAMKDRLCQVSRVAWTTNVNSLRDLSSLGIDGHSSVPNQP